MAQVNLGRVVGYSAYEIAVQNGFVGTEAEWLASLQGEDGEQGPQGPQGPAGPAGTTSWSGIEDKPFSTIGTGLTVSEGVLSADAVTFTESDPIFEASPAATITASDITAWNGKQDVLTAGTGIDITNGVISATGGGGSSYSDEDTLACIEANFGMASGETTVEVRHNSATYNFDGSGSATLGVDTDDAPNPDLYDAYDLYMCVNSEDDGLVEYPVENGAWEFDGQQYECSWNDGEFIWEVTYPTSWDGTSYFDFYISLATSETRVVTTPLEQRFIPNTVMLKSQLEGMIADKYGAVPETRTRVEVRQSLTVENATAGPAEAEFDVNSLWNDQVTLYNVSDNVGECEFDWDGSDFTSSDEAWVLSYDSNDNTITLTFGNDPSDTQKDGDYELIAPVAEVTEAVPFDDVFIPEDIYNNIDAITEDVAGKQDAFIAGKGLEFEDTQDGLRLINTAGLPTTSGASVGDVLAITTSGGATGWVTPSSSTGGVKVISVVGSMSKNNISAEDKAYMVNHYNDPVNYPFIMIYTNGANDPTGMTYYPIANHDGGNYLSVWCPLDNTCYKWIIANNTVMNVEVYSGPNAIINARTLQVFGVDGVTGSNTTIANNFKWIKDRLCPTTTDGTYVLEATVSSGVVTYSWVPKV